MQKNQLFSAQITSGIVILLIISLVSIFMSSPSVGVFGALSQLVVGIYSLVKFIIGLVLGIAFCIAFFIGLWFAIMYFVAPDEVGSMYDQLRERLGELFAPATRQINARVGNRKAASGDDAAPATDELAREIQALRQDLDAARQTIKELQAAKQE